MKSKENKLLTFLMQIGDLIFLNLLCLVCMLPVFTSGAAISALYSCVIKLVRKEDSHIFQAFFSAFRKNFKKATALFFLAIAVLSVLFADFILSRQFSGTVATLFLAVLAALFISFSMIAGYFFPLSCTPQLTLHHILKESFQLAFCHVSCSAVILFMNVLLPAVLLLRPDFFLRLLPLFVCLGLSAPAYANARIFLSLFGPLDETAL